MEKYHFDVTKIREDLSSALQRSFSDEMKIALFGAGNTAELAEDMFSEEFGLGENFDYFIDDTPKKQGTLLFGKPVINFIKAHDVCKKHLILLCCMLKKTRDAMITLLRDAPIDETEYCTFDEYIFCMHREEIISVFDMLQDDLSKATYANMILTRMGKEEQNFDYVFKPQYFGIHEYRKDLRNEVFVDLGAYVGDTIEQYINVRDGLFGKIFAFEPDDRLFKAMMKRVSRLREEWAIPEDDIELVQAGVGEESCNIRLRDAQRVGAINANLCGSSKVSGGGIKVHSIDDYFSDFSVSFIKADIESYEYKMLMGAENVIKRDRPRMAICIYHNPGDMYRIALKLKAFCPDYRLAVRQHSYEICDTVLYAY